MKAKPFKACGEVRDNATDNVICQIARLPGYASGHFVTRETWEAFGGKYPPAGVDRDAHPVYEQCGGTWRNGIYLRNWKIWGDVSGRIPMDELESAQSLAAGYYSEASHYRQNAQTCRENCMAYKYAVDHVKVYSARAAELSARIRRTLGVEV